jgi:hypothetical protein
MATAALGALPGLIGAGLDIYGGLNGIDMAKWIEGGKAGTLNLINSLLGNATNQVGQLSNSFIPDLTTFGTTGLGNSGQQTQQAANNLGYLNNLITGQPGAGGPANSGLFGNVTDASRIPGLQGVFDNLGSLISGANGASNIAAKNYANSGANNPLLQGAIGSALNLAGSGGVNGNIMNQIAQEMFGQRGGNQYTSAVEQSASPLLSSGGTTNNLNYVTDVGNALTQGSPLLTLAQGRAGNLISQNPLLPMNQVMSMAQNQSATQANQQYNALKRQLLDTTGVTGPAIASGGQNELLNNLGDQALQNQASAMTNAALNQQGLQLGQYGQGINLLNSALQGALGYSGQGLNAILNAAGQTTGNLATAGNLQLGASGQQLQNLMDAAGLSNTVNQTSLAGLNSAGGLFGTQGQLQASTGNTLAELLGLSGNLTNQTSQDAFGLQNFGQQNAQNISMLCRVTMWPRVILA